MFTIPINIGRMDIGRAMLNLGASINIFSSYLYYELGQGPLKYTRVAIQLADKTNILPLGKLGNIRVHMGEFTFLWTSTSWE